MSTVEPNSDRLDLRLGAATATALVVAVLASCAPAGESVDEAAEGLEEPPTVASEAGTIERLSPDLDELIPVDALVERVADGFQFTEGPVWVPSGGYLLFSDIPANKVYRWSEADGVSTFLDPVMAPDAETGGAGGSNGLALDAQGRLHLMEHGNRRVARMELPGGERETVVDSYEGLRLNSPNDGVFHSSGSLFFTDPPYGLPGQDDDPNKEQPHNGIYRLDPDGTLELLAQQKRPNGIGLSPDEATLYVANSDSEARTWTAYPVNGDLSLGEGQVLLDKTEGDDPGVPDGFAVGPTGHLWASGPGGTLIIAPDGRHLGTIRTAELPANVGFGEGGRSVFMTARTGLYRVKLSE